MNENLNTNETINEATNPACFLGAVMQCSVSIPKLIGDYWQNVQCKKTAKYEVKYKISKYRDTVRTIKCCTIHKTKLLKEIENDSFAELISVENIA